MSTDEQSTGQEQGLEVPASAAPVEGKKQQQPAHQNVGKKSESSGRSDKSNSPKGAETGGSKAAEKVAKIVDGASEQKEPAKDNQEVRSSKGGSRRRRSRGSGSGSNSATDSKSSPAHDPDQVAKYAWKIYLAEIGEEGVTMVDDRAAKELARRCFELAATFLDEQKRQ